MDEFREEREALKNADFKTKFRYFLDYYKWHVIVIVCVIGFVASYIHGIVTAKDAVLSGYLVNFFTDMEYNNELTTDFAEYAGIDTKEYEVIIDSTLQINKDAIDESTIAATQKLSVMIAAGEMDFLACDENTFFTYATPDYMYDLREFFTEEEFAKYEDYIYYVDMDLIREKEAIFDSFDSIAMENYKEPEYDHFAPEEMGDPMPIAICVEESPILKEYFYYYKGSIPMGIIVNSQHIDTTKQFIDYLFQGLLPE